MGPTVTTLRRLGAYLRAHGVPEWAEYVEALPPEGDAARAFTRSQAELGHPDPFRPRTERGRFMRTTLSTVAPNPRALAVLVALEGLSEVEDAAPADRESRVVAAPWSGWEPAAGGVRITWVTGLVELERVDVEETGEAVTITLLERHPPRLRADGSPSLPHAVRLERSVDVRLGAPLGARRVLDGAAGDPLIG